MLKSLQINGFKKIENVKIDNFKRVNIFVGTNNTGKTSILEAIFAFSCGLNLNPLIEVSMLRSIYGGMSKYEYMNQLMYGFFDHSKDSWNFSFKGENERGRTQSFSHHFSPGPVFSGISSSTEQSSDNYWETIETIRLSRSNREKVGYYEKSDSTATLLGVWDMREDGIKRKPPFKQVKLVFPLDRSIDNISKPYLLARYMRTSGQDSRNESLRIYSFLKRNNLVSEFLANLNHAFPELQIVDIESIPYPDEQASPVLFKTGDGELFPIHAFGSGVRKWYNFFGGMILYKGEKDVIHCLDEADVMLHPSAQLDFVRDIFKYAQMYNVQVFLTTHNLEFLDAIINVAHDSSHGDDLSVITLRNDLKNIKVRSLNGNEAFEARNEIGLELRS